MPGAIKETDYLCLTYSNRVDAALWHFKVCSKWAAAGGQESQRRSSHGCMDPSADPLRVSPVLQWSPEGQGKHWATAESSAQEGDHTPSELVWVSLQKQMSVTAKLIYPLACSLLLVINYLDIFITTYCIGWEANKEVCVKHAGMLKTKFLWLFVKTKHSPVFPAGPFKLAASGHIFLCELLAQKHTYIDKTTRIIAHEDNISPFLPLKKP